MKLSSLESEILRILEPRTEVALAWIYGSVAKGTDGPGSDLDLAIAGAQVMSLEFRVDLANQISLAVKKEVDLVDLQVERGIIASQVLTQGKLILNRDRAVLAGLIKRMWLDRADFWPHRERIYRARREKAFGKSK